MAYGFLAFSSFLSATSRVPMFRNVLGARFFKDYRRFINGRVGHVLGISVRRFRRFYSVFLVFF